MPSDAQLTLPTYLRDAAAPDVTAAAPGQGVEWLLAGGDGSFAMGTVRGPMARRYHGLLIGSLQPPVRRIMALSALAVSVSLEPDSPGEQRFDLACFNFRDGGVQPRGDQYLKHFACDGASCAWTYRLGPVELIVQLTLTRNRPGAMVRYSLRRDGDSSTSASSSLSSLTPATAATPGTPATPAPTGPLAARVTVRPLVALRDFHGLMLRDVVGDKFRIDHSSSPAACLATITADVHGGEPLKLHLRSDGGRIEQVMQWWYNFEYDTERERGYDYLEDLFHPCSFVRDLLIADGGRPSYVTVTAALESTYAPYADAKPGTPEPEDRNVDVAPKNSAAASPPKPPGPGIDPATFEATLTANTARLVALAAVAAKTTPTAPAAKLAPLVIAADAFIARRVPAPGSVAAINAPGEHGVTILAGYPWFADWGRDAMIALPGLLLATGRLDEARRILLTFANNRGTASAASGRTNTTAQTAADEPAGLVPNVFDDYTGQPHYNTVDASLWFIHSACEYVRTSRDHSTLARDLLPACLDIIGAYRQGTAFGIRMDPQDGLIEAGDHTTQLTWMDAKRDGVVFTPRHGKAVEINALWYHGLLSVAEAAEETKRSGTATELRAMAANVGKQFTRAFWNAGQACLFDCLSRDEAGVWHGDPSVRPNQLLAVSLRHSPLEQWMQQSIVKVALAQLSTPLGVCTLDCRSPQYKGRYRGRMFDRDAAYHNGTAWPWLSGPLAEALMRSEGFSPASREQARALLEPLIASMHSACLGSIAEVYDGDANAAEEQRPGGCPAQAWSVAEPLRALVLSYSA